MDIAASDLVTIGLLVVLEGLLSADNALVMAIMVLGLPRSDHHKALRYGLLGGFAFRAAGELHRTPTGKIHKPSLVDELAASTAI